MTDLSIDIAGIQSPNPFWLASGPPANTGYQVMKAFEAGWGGAVWKTLGVPIVNTTARYGVVDLGDRRMMGLNNIELITDRPLETNLREISEVKKRFPKHAVIASLMYETREEWKDAIRRCEDAGADGFELNYGCPHGMCERGMGSAVGQDPKANEVITGWVKEFATRPVLVKLTPSITDIRDPARAAVRGGADGISLINTVKSIVSVDIDRFTPQPTVGGKGTNGGYCGPAVKPIALFMVGELARDPEVRVPISGIGGVANWRDAVEFLLMGSTSVQVCTAVMHHGFRIVEGMIEGLSSYMQDKGFRTVREMVGKAVPNFVDWGDLDLNYKTVAKIRDDLCIQCQLCYIACHDTAYQCIHMPANGSRIPYVDEARCVGCNLCYHVCPVPGCIEMQERDSGKAPMTWNDYAAAGMKASPPPGSYGKI